MADGRLAGADRDAGAAAANEQIQRLIPQPVIQYQAGGFHVRCPHCLGRLFSSDIATWRAVAADDPAPKLAIKCAYRRNGRDCGKVVCLTWQE